MILTFTDIINSEEQQRILALLENAEFVDGRTTAGAAAAQVKRNEQLARNSPAYQEITSLFVGGLQRHNAFRSAVQPRRVHSMLVSRYHPGMTYGAHVDNAIMRSGDQMWRTDVSATLFLNDPSAYQGGELAIESGSGELLFKLPQRSLVCYPTTALHRVLPVTQGQRLVIVSWIHSLVRDPGQREILYDLDTTSRNLLQQHGKTREYDLVSKSYANLLRQWAEM